MDRGYIRISRKLFENPLWMAKPYSPGQAWVDLIQKAMFAAYKRDVNGHEVVIERGQFVRSNRELAEDWGWDKSAVARFLKKLRKRGMIETATETGVSIITLCNYDKYNPLHDDSETPRETRARHHRDTSETPPRHERDNNNKGNKREKSKEEKGRERAEKIPLHTQAANKVIEFLEENPDQLNVISSAAFFDGDWKKVVVDLYCRKCDAPQILNKAIRNPAAHMGWIQGDMQRLKNETYTGPKKAFASEAERIRAKYGTSDS